MPPSVGLWLDQLAWLCVLCEGCMPWWQPWCWVGHKRLSAPLLSGLREGRHGLSFLQLLVGLALLAAQVKAACLLPTMKGVTPPRQPWCWVGHKGLSAPLLSGLREGRRGLSFLQLLVGLAPLAAQVKAACLLPTMKGVTDDPKLLCKK